MSGNPKYLTEVIYSPIISLLWRGGLFLSLYATHNVKCVLHYIRKSFQSIFEVDKIFVSTLAFPV